MTYKIGLDYHGVIDKSPTLFAFLSYILTHNWHEVHILTGKRITKEFRKSLDDFGIRWTHLFSITDWCIAMGYAVTFDDHGNPYVEDKYWNSAKAVYCLEKNIDLHIDDSPIYGKYFRTPYLRFYPDGDKSDDSQLEFVNKFVQVEKKSVEKEVKKMVEIQRKQCPITDSEVLDFFKKNAKDKTSFHHTDIKRLFDMAGVKCPVMRDDFYELSSGGVVKKLLEMIENKKGI